MTNNNIAGNGAKSTDADLVNEALINQAEALLRAADKKAEGQPASATAGLEEPKQTNGESHLFEVLGSYGKYVSMFVGAGLISGSVVHFPLAPGRYLLVGACGAVLFTFASIVSEIRSKKASPAHVVKIAVASLLLALGIGMVSGGIQHFQDFPPRAAVLIPLGLGLSTIAFVFRNGYKISGLHRVWLAAGIIWGLLIVGVGLNYVAGSMGESGSHSHGTEATVPAADEAKHDVEDGHSATETKTTSIVTTAVPAKAPASASADDHSSHGH